MKNIYLLYGENKDALLEYQEQLAKKYLGESLDNFTYIKFNMQETTIEELIYECQSAGFFSSKKVVVASNCVFLTAKPKKVKVEHNIDVLQEYVKNLNEDIVLVLTSDDNVDSRKKIVKDIKSVGEVVTFTEYKEKELASYIVQYLKEKEIKISAEDANFLVIYSRLDFGGIKRELEKLELYAAEKRLVTREDIELLVVRSLEYDVFALTNELFSKNYTELRKVYNGLKLKGEEPVFLLSLITGQIRLYYKVKILLQENFSQKDIASKLAVHPYRVQLAAQKVYNYNIFTLFDIIMICKEYDKKLKSSYIDKYIELDLFINKLIEKIK